MPFKLVALVRRSEKGEDKEPNADFERAQLPFLKGLAGAQRISIGTVVGSLRGDSPFERMVEVYFEDEATAKAALADPEVRARGRELFTSQGKMKLMFVEERPETGEG